MMSMNMDPSSNEQMIRRLIQRTASSLNIDPDNSALQSKLKFLDELDKNKGNTKCSSVKEAIQDLEKFSPNAAARMTELQDGMWEALSSPEYPGKIGDDDEGCAMFKLGRMSFNMFEPRDLIMTVTGIDAPMKKIEGEGASTKWAYDVSVALKDSKTGKILSTIKTYGIASPNEKDENRLDVVFTRGELIPSEENTDIDLWKKTFGKQGTNSGLRKRDRFALFIAKVFMGLKMPAEMNKKEPKVEYEMTRAPHGYLDILYIDQNLRITRGNQGSIVVVGKET